MAEIERISRQRPYPEDRLIAREPTDTPIARVHPLDSPAAVHRLSQLKEWRAEARLIHAPNREQQAIDADFYDGLQWNEADIADLLERRQAPLVFNVVKKHLNWVVGTERRTRVDFRVFPREEEDRQPAETKTKLLKYVSDVNKSPFHRSLAFQDMVKVGVGWLEDGIRRDPDEEPLFSRSESWRNLWWDPYSRAPDLDDCRYLFREKYADLDWSIAVFPERAAFLEQSAVQADLFGGQDDDEEYYLAQSRAAQHSLWYPSSGALSGEPFSVGQRRQRVKLTEMWWRRPARMSIARPTPGLLPDERAIVKPFTGLRMNPKDTLMQSLVQEGLITLHDAVRMEMRVAIWCEGALLLDIESPYRHRRYPFIPLWCYRRDRDHLPYGLIRDMRDPQEDLNKRRSKALHILSTNRLIADEDAFEDWDEVEEELSRPDSILRKRKGTEVEIQNQTELAEEHVKLMEQDVQFIEQLGAVEESVGEETNAVSGRAIIARQTAGGVTTASLFDNLRFSLQLQGENQLALVEQFYDEAKVFRLTNERGSMEFIRVNEDETNSIVASMADFIIDTQDFRESVRLAMAEQLLDLMKNLPPEVSLKLLDLVVEMLDVPNREEIVKRIRKMTGEVDPDSPEAEQLEAARDAQAAEQAKLAEDQIRTEVEERQAKAADVRASAFEKAVQIAQLLAATPALAPAVDELLRSLQVMTPATEGAAAAMQDMPDIRRQPVPEETGTIPPQGRGTPLPAPATGGSNV